MARLRESAPRPTVDLAELPDWVFVPPAGRVVLDGDGLRVEHAGETPERWSQRRAALFASLGLPTGYSRQTRPFWQALGAEWRTRTSPCEEE